MSTQTEDKPFKCPKCSQCFASSDRLSAHQKSHTTKQKSLKVKIPGLVADSVSDQTPTPTRFLKTADVEVAQLFEEINPFDQDFRLASKRQISTVSVTSTTSDDSETQNALQFVKGIKAEAIQHISTSQGQADGKDSESNQFIPAEVQLSFDSPIQPRITNHQTVSSTTSSDNTINKPTEELTAASREAILKLQEVLAEFKYPPLQDVTSQIAQPQPQPPQQIQPQVLTIPTPQQTPQPIQPAPQIQPTQPTAVAHPTTQATDANKTQSDLIREQLQALVNSGQIKIQFTSHPSSPKVQATIVGTVAKTAQPTAKPSPQVNRYQPIQPFHVTESLVDSSFTKLADNTSMSIVSLPSSILNSNMVQVTSLPGTNLAVAKQKLKEVIIQQNGSENNNLIGGGRVTMISHSNQGKYKDIILSEDAQQNLNSGELGKRKRTVDDLSPDEKRRKFLERNRAAASRCRQKRKIWVNQLEKKSDDLQRTNNQLINEIQALRTEVAQLKALLIAHKDCPVTLQQKALLGQIGSSNQEAYIAVSGGQIIAIEVPPTTSNGMHPTSAEEVASSALTDMADRATIELSAGSQANNGTVTIQTSDGSVSTIPTSSLISQ